MAAMRVGIGYDIHRLVSDRKLILGGIEIEHDRGLLAHSDGDVVLHALADACLGAAGMGDIGEMFPDTDERYKDADSRELLKTVMARVKKGGYHAAHVDIIVHAERPNLSRYKKPMAEAIAGLVDLDWASVNVKAKTNEGLGPIGTREAIACSAVVTLIAGPMALIHRMTGESS